MNKNPLAKEIVVVGAGFAGAYTFKYLCRLLGGRTDIELNLVNENNYFLFSPFLDEVAAGEQSPETLAELLTEVFPRQKLQVAAAQKVDTKTSTLQTSAGPIKYDYLVLALGAATAFYQIKGAQANSLTLKTAADADRIKNRLFKNFAQASSLRTNDEQARLLHFVIVGGGATGVELAAGMADILGKNGGLDEKIKISLLDAQAEILPAFPKKIREKTLQFLQAKKVKLRLNSPVNEVGADYVKLGSGEIIKTVMVIWAAGIEAREIEFDEPVAKKKNGAIEVNEFLQVKNHPNIFCLGDMAAILSAGDNKEVPATAQAAVKEAKAVAANISRLLKNKPLRPFTYRHGGDIISVGKGRAIGCIAGFVFAGRLAWWLHRLVYLSKLLSWRKKIRVAAGWMRDI